MSPASVSNFVGDLVAMATAFERLPQVEADLAEARNQINSYLATIQRLETKLLDKNSEIEAGLSTIRALEVARDDAQFHALEADDRTQRALEFIKATFGNAGALIQALEPPATPKPEPATSDVPVSAMPEASGEAPVTMPINDPEPGQSEPLPTDVMASTSANGVQPIAPASAHSETSPSPAPEVAASSGEPDATTTDTIHDTATSVSAELPKPASSEPSPAPDASKPYAGKKYSEVDKAERGKGNFSWWASQEAWLAGGGTLDNYYA